MEDSIQPKDFSLLGGWGFLIQLWTLVHLHSGWQRVSNLDSSVATPSSVTAGAICTSVLTRSASFIAPGVGFVAWVGL